MSDAAVSTSKAADPLADGGGFEMPRHVAIIMDGNGRWAAARGLPRVEGHRRGVEALRKTVRAASDLGISVLRMAGAGHIRQALYEGLGLTHYQLRNHFVVEAIEQHMVTGQVAAIQKGNGEFNVGCIEAVALRQHASGRAQLQVQIPHVL